MDFSAILGLLMAALSLLGFVEQHPSLPQSSVEQAKMVAQQAILQATNALKSVATTGVKPVTPETNIAFTSAELVVGTPSGSAPLTVTLEGKIQVPPTHSGSAVMFFGDGTSDIVFRSNSETYQETWTHTYPKAGTYDAILALSSVSDIDADIQVLKDPAYAKNQIVKKAAVNLAGRSTVQIISWDIEQANPHIMNQSDHLYYEQKIFIDVTSADSNTTRYDLGTAHGCFGSNEVEELADRKVLGRMDCYFAATGVDFVAYVKGGKFFIERRDDDVSGYAAGKTKIILEI